MKNKIEDTVNRSGNNLANLAKKSMNWFYTKVKKFFSTSKEDKEVLKTSYNPAKDPFIGGMFQFIYDPKWKEELPYWDKFPLVIPIEIYNNGFLGLNLHYLPPILRAKLLDELIRLKVEKPGKNAYMKVSYSILKQVAASELYKPCIKRYLTSHIMSSIINIDPDQWEETAFLPTQQFQKVSHREVWSKAK